MRRAGASAHGLQVGAPTVIFRVPIFFFEEAPVIRCHPLTVLFALFALSPPLAAQSLDRPERRMRDVIAAAREEQIAYLQRVVDIPSSTLNFDGVRKVGAALRASLDSLGFTTSWAAVAP